jgi:polysaccharide biosynthesis transport protein
MADQGMNVRDPLPDELFSRAGRDHGAHPGGRVIAGDLFDNDGLMEGLDETFANYRRFWASVVKAWRLILAIVAIAIVIGGLVTLLMTPVFRATTSIQIERETTKVLNIEDVQPVEQAAETDRFLQTQVELLESRSLAKRVGENLNLFANDDFLATMGSDVDTDGMRPDDARAKRERAVVSTLTANLEVKSSRSSRLVRISFDSPDARLAARITDAYAENFISANLERRFESSAYARDFLERQLGNTKARLEESERQIIAYARKAELIDTSRSGSDAQSSVQPASLTTANLVALNSAFASARGERIAAEERWRQASSSAIWSLPQVLDNQTIQELQQKRATLRAEYLDRGRIFKEDYPTMRQMSAQIDEINVQLDGAANNIRATLRTQYDVARKQEEALSSEVNRLKASTLDEQSRSIQFNILKREADTNRILYDALLQRYKEVSAAGGSTSNNVSIIDTARIPSTPVRPKPLLNILIAAIAGLFLGLLLAIARERFDDTIRTPDDLRSKLALPLIGTVPKLRGEANPHDELLEPRSDLTEAYASIRTALQFSSTHGVPSPLLVTSSRPSEGKTTTAVAIAMSFTRIGKRVLLIDSDLRNPSVHGFFGQSNRIGFTNVLSGQHPLKAAVQETSIDGLSLITCGPIPPDPAELLAGGALEIILDQATASYDVVVVDGPPVMGLADALLVSMATNATLFVVEAGKTHRGQTKAALARLRSINAKLVGAVLSKFDRRQMAYGTDYQYAYEYSYTSKK